MIEGVKINKILVHEDKRGNFREIMRAGGSILGEIKQISISRTRSGVIKAFHWHKYQDDVFYAVSGNFKIVLHDLRKNSSTFSKTQVILAGESNGSQVVFIPRGVAHGYQVLGNKEGEMLYVMNKEYDASKPDEERIPHNDPKIGFDWNDQNKTKKDKKKVLIIGASGRLGSQLMEDFSRNYDVVGTCHSNKKGSLLNLDITNPSQIKSLIEIENPDIVILSAAKTNVEQCELNSAEAIRVNVEGTKNVVNNCKNRKLVFFSTDSIFDGKKKIYTEKDQPNATNNYSKTKLNGEKLVRTLRNYLIIRTARLYGMERDSPKFVNYVIRTLREGKEIKAPVDTLGNPTFIPDVSNALQTLIKKNKMGIYHVVGSDAHTLYETALKIAEVMDFDKSLITPVGKNYFNSNVKRPTQILSIGKINNEGITMGTLEEGLKKIKDYQEEYKELTKCRICGCKNLFIYLDLGDIPLINSYINEEGILGEKKYPLKVALCEECSFSQLDVIVDPSIMFRDYAYRSAISEHFQQHCDKLAEELHSSKIVSPGELVVDIASNDGTLLKKFKKRKSVVLGVDPAQNLAKIANKEGVETFPEFWNPDLAKKILNTRGPAKVITAFNVFAHVNDLHSFTGAVKILLDKDGYFIIESPHLLNLIKEKQFDTIYHEHLSYLLVKPVQRLMGLHGLRVAKVKQTPLHGGSVRFYIEHKNREPRFDGSLERVVEKEENFGLYTKGSYLDFRNNVNKIKEVLVKTLSDLKKEGKKIAGFGASAKGNVLLNYFRINNKTISYIVDDTPEKQNKLTPGTHIPIVKRDTLKNDTPDYLLILAWNFAKEIMEKTKEYRKSGGKYIIPIPEPTIV